MAEPDWDETMESIRRRRHEEALAQKEEMLQQERDRGITDRRAGMFVSFSMIYDSQDTGRAYRQGWYDENERLGWHLNTDQK